MNGNIHLMSKYLGEHISAVSSDFSSARTRMIMFENLYKNVIIHMQTRN